MADSTIQIDLELRKEQAEQRLRNFEEMAREQLEKLQRVQARYDANPNGFTRNQLEATRRGYQNRLEGVADAQRQVEQLEIQLDQNSVKRGARLFGITVSENVARFAKQFVGAYLGRELINLGFAAAYTPGGNNANLRRAEAATEGAMTAGAMGFAIAGPMGAAIGGLTGAILGLSNEMVRQTKELQAQKTERINNRVMQGDRTSRDIGNKAFSTLVDQTVGRANQMEMLLNRRRNIEFGDGNFSLKTIESKLNRMTDPNSNRYKQLQEMHSQALAEKAQLEQEIFALLSTPIHQITDPSSLTDSFAKQGLYSGIDTGKEGALAGIDFEAINNPVVNELKEIRGLLRTMAGSGDRQSGYGNVSRRAVNMVFDAKWQ